MFELKNLWVSFSKLFQDTQLSQVKTLSFHMALYAHTHIISFTFSLFSQTHSYTYKLQVPDTFTVRPSLKKATEHPSISLRLNPSDISHWDSSHSTSSCGNTDGRCATLDANL